MKTYGLIGFPLEQSFSKKYFTAKFEKAQMQDVAFELFPLQYIEDFPHLVSTVNPAGLAVTIPHKQAVMPYLDELNEEAEKIGAVNCICFNAGRTKGYNTDAKGFEESLLPLLKPQHRRALIFGTGGAAKAVEYVLQKLNIEYLRVSRSSNGDISYTNLTNEHIAQHTLLINASPAGMVPNDQTFPPIPYQAAGSDHLFYDLVYKPEKTLFLKFGEARGAVIKNGFEMLIIQAEENWRLWNLS